MSKDTKLKANLIKSTGRKQTTKKGELQPDFLTMLNDTSQAMLAAEAPSTSLNILANRACELFNADNCYISPWDESHQSLSQDLFCDPIGRKYQPVNVQSSIQALTAAALDSFQTIAVTDTSASPYIDSKISAEFPNRSLLTLPLFTGTLKLGGLVLGYNMIRRFTKKEIKTAEIAAQQISLVVAKAYYLEKAYLRVRELTGLHEVSQTFSAQSDTYQTFGLLSQRLATLVDALMCAIILYDPEQDELRAQIPGYGLLDEQLSTVYYPSSLGEQAWNFSKRGVLRANSLKEIPTQFTDLAHSFGVTSLVVAPMRTARDGFVGLIFAANKAGGFTKNDEQLLALFAEQAAVVVQNTQLFAAERKRSKELAILHDIALAAINATNEDELIELVTTIIGANLYPDNFGILLLDQRAGELYLHTSYRMGEREMPIRISLGEGITGQVAKTGLPRRTEDVSKDPYYLAIDPRIKSELCVPVKLGGHVIGVINAESSRVKAFTHADENLLTIAAGQLATSIDRLRKTEAEYQKTAQLVRSNALIRVLAQVGALASAALDPDGVMQTMGSELAKIGFGCIVALYAPDAQDKLTFRYYTINPNTIKLIEKVVGGKIQDFRVPAELFLAHTNQAQLPSFLSDTLKVATAILQGFPKPALDKVLRSVGVTGNTTICHLPLVAESKLKGILWLWGEGLRESDLPTMSVFASQIAIALQNANLLAEVQRLATTDELTGVYNRRHFYEIGHREFDRARRYKHPLSALFLDIDHFKHVNDYFGHAAGDKTLQKMIDLCQNQLRSIDLIGRYGGDEFIILLAETIATTAREAAERLRKLIGKMQVQYESSTIRITVSIGIAGMDENTSDLTSLIERADQATYAAKQAGRNRVVMK